MSVLALPARLDNSSSRFHGLIKLRWAIIVAELCVFYFAKSLIDVPYSPFAVILSLSIATNVLLQLNIWNFAFKLYESGGAIAVLDVILITMLLYFYGGHANPFSIFYLVYVTIAAFFFGSLWTWITLGVSIGCYLILFSWHVPLSALEMHGRHDVAGSGFNLHLHGMLIAFIVVGSLIAFFIARMSREIQTFQERKFTEDKLSALVALSAGAAHELATPLGTVHLIAEQLNERRDSSEPLSSCADELEELRNELERAKQVLERMRSRSPELQGERQVEVLATEMIERVVRRFSKRDQERVRVQCSDVNLVVNSLPLSLEESLFVLVKNALEESPAGQFVYFNAFSERRGIKFVVRDEGKGVPEEQLSKLGEPFFTTKVPGRGMGLGLFLVRNFAAYIKGSVSFRRAEPGLEVSLYVPN